MLRADTTRLTVGVVMVHSFSWLLFCKVSMLFALLAVALGVFWLPTAVPMIYYQSVSSLFLLSACLTLLRTLRDEQEARRLLLQVNPLVEEL